MWSNHGIVLPAMWHDDGRLVVAARPSAALRHRTRHRRAQGAMARPERSDRGTDRPGSRARESTKSTRIACRPSAWPLAQGTAMKRVSVDIGGTFTDCFVVWNERYVEGKALTTHHNLALGFNESLADACKQLNVEATTLLSQVDSVRYATTLGTNALIERKGPRIGLLVTTGFKHTIPLSRARGYGEGLSEHEQMDVPTARPPHPLVPIPIIPQLPNRSHYLAH